MPGRLALRGRVRWIVLIAFVFLVIVAAAVGGAYGYAMHQWRSAESAIKKGRPAEARKHLSRCLWFWPRSPEVHLLAARAARMEGDLTDAEAHLNRCLVLQKGASESVQLEFLLLRLRSGEENEVVPVLIDCVEKRHPETPIILETLAQLYIRRLRWQPAYACLTNWIEYDPQSAKAHFWRGWVLERVNSPGRAKEDFRRAVELDPEMVEPRVRLVEVLLLDNSPLEAEPHLQFLQARYPTRPDVLAKAGQYYYLKGQYAEARKSLEAAEQGLPDDLIVLSTLTKIDLLDRRAAEAERRIHRILKIDSTDTEARYLLVQALQQQGRREEAVQALADYKREYEVVARANKLLQDEAEHPGESAQRAYEIGLHLINAGKRSTGVYWLEQALQRDPLHEATHRALADHYEQAGDKQTAAMHRRFLPPEKTPGDKDKKPESKTK